MAPVLKIELSTFYVRSEPSKEEGSPRVVVSRRAFGTKAAARTYLSSAVSTFAPDASAIRTSFGRSGYIPAAIMRSRAQKARGVTGVRARGAVVGRLRCDHICDQNALSRADLQAK